MPAAQLSLFDAPAPPVREPADVCASKVAECHRKARLAYQATSGAWKSAVYKFAVEQFLPRHSEFIFENLTIAYSEAEKSQGLPATVDKRAFAGLRMRLIREKLIEVIPGVFENRTQGSPSQKYRRVL